MLALRGQEEKFDIGFTEHVTKFWATEEQPLGKAHKDTSEAFKKMSEDIVKAPYYKKLVQWVCGYVEEQGATQAASAIVMPSASKSIEENSCS